MKQSTTPPAHVLLARALDEDDAPRRWLVIGSDPAGRLLELVVLVYDDGYELDHPRDESPAAVPGHILSLQNITTPMPLREPFEAPIPSHR